VSEPDDRLFDEAREAVDVRGLSDQLKLVRAGRGMRGVCPFGACGAKSKSQPFWLDEDARRFRCFSCDERGDALALDHHLNSRLNESLRAFAARLLNRPEPGARPRADAKGSAKASGPRRADDYAPAQGITGAGLGPARSVTPKPRAEVRDDSRRDAYIRQVARELWACGRAAAGTPVEWYLRGRGLDGWVLASMLAQLRFHPAAQHPDVRDRTFAAMVGLIVAPEGGRAVPTGGVHATYLAEDGDLTWRKAGVDRAKVIWGPPKLNDRVWGGVWLTSPSAPGPLMSGEGIESTGSAMMLAGEACRGVATLSLNALQGRWLEDRWGRVDPAIPRLDPEAPGFTWPQDPAAPWGEIRVCIDRDMSPIRRRVRRPMGGTERQLIDGETRSRVCAALAEAGWRQALVAGRDANGGRASATIVKTWAPGPGRDFSDELAARTAGELHETARSAPWGVTQ
jgi:hypothetical protein